MPGHPIPEPYVWDESFKVFYDNLDDEHKGLFDGVFACAKDKTSQEKLDTLRTAVKEHFSTEEGMMKAKEYSNFTTHKAAHDTFVAKLAALSAPLADETIDYAKEWLVNHIIDIDFNYKEKL